MASPPWWLYMIRTRAGTIYTGITTDVDRRFRQHATGRGSRYLRARGPATILLRQRIGPRSLAAKLEYQVKRLDRRHKELIVAAGRLRFSRTSGRLSALFAGGQPPIGY
ncbi:MAG: GIY-YIG nuclease family protein [Verrucomicrobiae bacterium]|nr:GIY-YIG nuclease family protein [Verrucomicrobiae bacterium]